MGQAVRWRVVGLRLDCDGPPTVCVCTAKCGWAMPPGMCLLEQTGRCTLPPRLLHLKPLPLHASSPFSRFNRAG
jgi:hypothetical protein